MTEAIWTPYCGKAPVPADILLRWNLDPLVIGALGLCAMLIALRGRRPAAGLAGLAVLAIIFLSPLCALSSALFAARTVHHVLLVALAAPLLAMSMPAIPRRGLTAAVVVQAAVFWAWHAPAAYGWALGHDGGYWLMQASLLASALWFWAAVSSAPALAGAVALLAAMVAMGLIGAVLTFSQSPLYAPHLASTWAWGLDPLEDQQAGGLIMWAPAAAIYLLAALAAVGRGIGPGVRHA